MNARNQIHSIEVNFKIKKDSDGAKPYYHCCSENVVFVHVALLQGIRCVQFLSILFVCIVGSFEWTNWRTLLTTTWFWRACLMDISQEVLVVGSIIGKTSIGFTIHVDDSALGRPAISKLKIYYFRTKIMLWNKNWRL